MPADARTWLWVRLASEPRVRVIEASEPPSPFEHAKEGEACGFRLLLDPHGRCVGVEYDTTWSYGPLSQPHNATYVHVRAGKAPQEAQNIVWFVGPARAVHFRHEDFTDVLMIDPQGHYCLLLDVTEILRKLGVTAASVFGALTAAHSDTDPI